MNPELQCVLSNKERQKGLDAMLQQRLTSYSQQEQHPQLPQQVDSPSSDSRRHRDQSRLITATSMSLSEQLAGKLSSAHADRNARGSGLLSQLHPRLKALLLLPTKDAGFEVDAVDDALEEDDIAKFVEKHKKKVQGPKALQLFVSACRARYARKRFIRYLMVRRKHVHRTMAQHLHAWLEYTSAVTYQDRYLKRRCLHEWAEYSALKMELCEKVIGLFKARMANAGSFLSPFQLRDTSDGALSDDDSLASSAGMYNAPNTGRKQLQSSKIMTVTSVVASLLQRIKPFQLQRQVLMAWREVVVEKRKKKMQAVLNLVQFNAEALWSKVHDAFRFWFRWAVSRVASRANIDLPLFRPQLVCWDTWLSSHKRSVDLGLQSLKLHRGFRLRHCMYWWYTYTQRIAAMRLAWYRAGLHPEVLLLREAFIAFKVNRMNASMERQGMRRVLHYWHLIASYLHHMRSMKYALELVVHRQRKAYTFRKWMAYTRAMQVMVAAGIIKMQQCYSQAIFYMFAMRGNMESMYFILCWRSWVKWVQGRMHLKTALGAHHHRKSRMLMELTFMGWRKVAHCMVQKAEDDLDIDADLFPIEDTPEGVTEGEDAEQLKQAEGKQEEEDDEDHFVTLSDYPMRLPWRPTATWTQIMLIKRSKKAPPLLALHAMCDNLLNLEGPYTGGATGSALSMEECLLRVWHRRPPSRNQIGWVRHGQGLKAWQKSRNKDPWWWQRMVGLTLQKNPHPFSIRALLPNKAEHLPLMPILQARYSKLKEEGITNAWLPPTVSPAPRTASTILASRQRIPAKFDEGAARSISWIKHVGPQLQDTATEATLPVDSMPPTRAQTSNSVPGTERASASAILARIEQTQAVQEDISFMRTGSGLPEGEDDMRDDVSLVSDAETSISNASSWWQVDEDDGIFDCMPYDDLLFYQRLTEAEAFLDFVVHVKMGLGAEGTHHLNPILLEKLSPLVHFKKIGALHGDVLTQLLAPAVQHDCQVAHTLLQWMLNRERSVYGAAHLHEKAQALSRHRPGFTLSVPLEDLCARWQVVWDNCPPDSDEDEVFFESTSLPRTPNRALEDSALRSFPVANKSDVSFPPAQSGLLSFSGGPKMALDAVMPPPQYPLTADSDSGEDDVITEELALKIAAKHGGRHQGGAAQDHNVLAKQHARSLHEVGELGSSASHLPAIDSLLPLDIPKQDMELSNGTTSPHNQGPISQQQTSSPKHLPTHLVLAGMSHEPSPRLNMMQDWIAEQASTTMVSASSPTGSQGVPSFAVNLGTSSFNSSQPELSSRQQSTAYRHTGSAPLSQAVSHQPSMRTQETGSIQKPMPAQSAPAVASAVSNLMLAKKLIPHLNDPPASKSFYFQLPGAAVTSTVRRTEEQPAPEAVALPVVSATTASPSSDMHHWRDHVTPEMPDLYDIVMRYAVTPSPAGSVRGVQRQESIVAILDQLNEILNEDVSMLQKSALLAKAAMEQLNRRSQDDVGTGGTGAARVAGRRKFSAFLKWDKTGASTPAQVSTSPPTARAEETLASVMQQIEDMLKLRLPPTPPTARLAGLDQTSSAESLDNVEASVKTLKRPASTPLPTPPVPPKHEFLRKRTGTFCHNYGRALTNKRDRIKWLMGTRSRYNPYGAVKSKVAKEIEEFSGRLKHTKRRHHPKTFLHSHKNVRMRLYRKKKKGERSAPSSTGDSEPWESVDLPEGFDSEKLEQFGCYGVQDWSALHDVLAQKTAAGKTRIATVKKSSKPAWNSYIPDITGPPKKRQKQVRTSQDSSKKLWLSSPAKSSPLFLPLIPPPPSPDDPTADSPTPGLSQPLAFSRPGTTTAEMTARREMADQSSSFGEWSYTPEDVRKEFLPSISNQVQSGKDITQLFSSMSSSRLSRGTALPRQHTRRRGPSSSRASSRQSHRGSTTFSLRHMSTLNSSSSLLPAEDRQASLAEDDDEFRDVWQSPQNAEGHGSYQPSQENLAQQIQQYLDNIAQEEWEQYASDANDLLVQLAKVLHVDAESLRLATAPPLSDTRPNTPGSSASSTVNKFSHAARQALASTSRKRACQERPKSAHLLPRRKSLGILPRIRVKKLQDAIAKGLHADDVTGGLNLVHCDDDMLQLVSRLVLKPYATRLLFLHQLQQAQELRQKVMDTQSLERQLHELVWEPVVPGRQTSPGQQGRLRTSMLRLSNNSAYSLGAEGSYTSTGIWEPSVNNPPSATSSSWSPMDSPGAQAEVDLVRSERVQLKTRHPRTLDKELCEPPITSKQSSPHSQMSPGRPWDGSVMSTAAAALADTCSSKHPAPHGPPDPQDPGSCHLYPVPQQALQTNSMVHRRLGRLQTSKHRVGELEEMEWNDFSAYSHELDQLATATMHLNTRKIAQWYKTQYAGGIHAAIRESGSGSPRASGPRPQGSLQPMMKTGGALPLMIYKSSNMHGDRQGAATYGHPLPAMEPSLHQVLPQYTVPPHRQLKPVLSAAPLGHTAPPTPPRDGNPALLLYSNERAPLGVQAAAPVIKHRPAPEKRVQYISLDTLTARDLALSSGNSSFSSLRGGMARTKSYGPVGSSSQPTREHSQLSRSTSVASIDRDPAVSTTSLLVKPRLLSPPLKLSQQLKGWSETRPNDDEFKEVFGSLLGTHRSST